MLILITIIASILFAVAVVTGDLGAAVLVIIVLSVATALKVRREKKELARQRQPFLAKSPEERDRVTRWYYWDNPNV
jgi:hypothetical protein